MENKTIHAYCVLVLAIGMGCQLPGTTTLGPGHPEPGLHNPLSLPFSSRTEEIILPMVYKTCVKYSAPYHIIPTIPSKRITSAPPGKKGRKDGHIHEPKGDIVGIMPERPSYRRKYYTIFGMVEYIYIYIPTCETGPYQSTRRKSNKAYRQLNAKWTRRKW